MLRSRIIPVLLIRNGGLVKTQKFSEAKYVGDPINAVRIFNEKQADEICIFDIDASADNREPNYQLIQKLATECQMPLCYGGGIKTIEQALRILGLGVEKVAISSRLIECPEFAADLAEKVGTQSVVAVLDIKKTTFKRLKVSSINATKIHDIEPIPLAKTLVKYGVGEVMLNFIDNDGMMKGYDYSVVASFRDALDVPLTVLGGAGSYSDLQRLSKEFGPIGCAAGSLFVFKGRYRAVLISYPNLEEKRELCF